MASAVEACPAGPSSSTTSGGPARSQRPPPVARIPTRQELPTITHLAKRPAVDLEFHDLCCTVRSHVRGAARRGILKSVNGHFRCGELSAILGPSGAGKSTLMDILAGHKSCGVTGTVWTSGRPRHMRLFNKLSAYIEQEDLVQPRLTVAESLTIAANLKLGDELSPRQRTAVVEEVLSCLSLGECRDTRSERLSGGQRKRLSVALELVNNPPVIFLDEPTTGLDVVTAKKCVDFLKTLSQQGRTIVCTIHQPTSSVFMQFDNVFVLAQGRCVYHGSPDNMVHFLESADMPCPTSHNPADFIMELVQGEEEDHVTTLAAKMADGRCRQWQVDASMPAVASARSATVKLCREDTLKTLPMFADEGGRKDSWSSMEYPTSFWTQFRILLARMLTQLSRNKAVLLIQLLHHLLSAMLLGTIYFGTGDDMTKPFMNFKFSISVMVFFMYTHVMAPVLLFPTEVKLLKREYCNRWYSLLSYYMALTVATLAPLVIFGMVFLSVSYILSSQPLELTRFLRFSAICLLLGAVSESHGLLVGSLFSVMNGSVVAPASFSPLLALSVYGMNHGSMTEPGMSVLMALSYLRYGLVGIAQSLYGYGRAPMHCEGSAQYCHYKYPAQFLHDLNMDDGSTGYQAAALVVFLLVHRCLVYLALKYRMSNEFSGRLINLATKVLRLR